MSPAENSTDIYNQLINSPHESIVKSEIDTGDYTNDITPPYTPYSVNSASQQTNFTGVINTAPCSPASSIATTNATSTTTRRGRGRPAKEHSDMPDLSRVQSEAERKKALERYKNNEASRKSRLKNKERDMATEQEERELSQRTEELEREFQMLKRIERKLRQALKRQHFRCYPSKAN